jgi:rSAM/selenodomain-associated transferase 2
LSRDRESFRERRNDGRVQRETLAVKHKISIIIPVLNEAPIIQDTIDHILGLPRGGGLEVIVVDGSPRGETIRVIRDANVKKFSAEKGRSRQMNNGASAASGEILLFLHSDTKLPIDALKSICSLTDKREIVGGAFDLGILSDRPVFRLIEKAASLRSRITRVPYGDQAIFIRKDFFDEIGGFKDIPLMEDVELMRRIKKAGGKIQIIRSSVKTSPRRWEKEGVVRCTLRNWMLITLYHLGLSPEKLVRFYS